MNRSSYTRTIHHLCLQKEQEPFVTDIEDKLGLTIPMIKPEELMLADRQHRHKILLINYSDHHAINSQLRALPLVNKLFEVIVFNVNKRLTTDELLAMGNLKGLFYNTDSMEAIAHGCAEIINGQNWLPRKVASQLLHYYRQAVDCQTAPATVDLTNREIQLLGYLKTGASNIQIAEEMFISEFTVKSHLYQIYKKLSVKNRLQAAAWARQHILS
ncbi:LuxR C-terminal-related transcriptional regulator [Vibrio sp. TRT 17S01]|uniref:LuxR C-terminal-related transcriptional regulator n=1 Tax=Vibrio sp. TRT 17S01 TaxID=3418505 RepID=UPI003CED53A6